MAAVKAKVIDGTGKSTGDQTLPEALFGGEVNVRLMHQVVTAQLAEARSGTASTKTRSEVRGGGQKPWRQKGTGRARHGSTRSPIWVGGGTVFGPKPRDHSVRTNKKMRKIALRSALASKASDGRVWVLDGFSDTKTKAAAGCLAAAGIDGRVLLVLDPPGRRVHLEREGGEGQHHQSQGQVEALPPLSRASTGHQACGRQARGGRQHRDLRAAGLGSRGHTQVKTDISGAEVPELLGPPRGDSTRAREVARRAPAQQG